jgi:2-polyprenyl-3-methyl-5-hydroxy-6-metoxy-1,4-benzoquinol methylase
VAVEREVIENGKRFIERANLYKKFGYDIEKERKYILDKAKPLYGNILEIGTGKGYLAVELAKQGFKFTSIDISKEDQEFARLNLKYFGLEKYVNFRIENAENLSFGDKSFDIIFLVNVVHHLTNPFRVMDEVIRVVTSGGKIILSDFTKDGFDIVDKVLTSEGRRHEVSKITLTDIKRYLQEKGFITTEASSKFQEILIAQHS